MRALRCLWGWLDLGWGVVGVVGRGKHGRFFPEFLVQLGLAGSALGFGGFSAWEWRLGLGFVELLLSGG